MTQEEFGAAEPPRKSGPYHPSVGPVERHGLRGGGGGTLRGPTSDSPSVGWLTGIGLRFQAAKPMSIGGFQNYPDDYEIINQLHARGEMTLRIAYNLFTQKPKQEKEDFARWIKMTGPGQGDDFLRCNGAGEMLVFSAADFEDFLEPRPDLNASLEGELKEVVALLAANQWPFRLHATYDESITRFLNVFEEVNRDVPRNPLLHCAVNILPNDESSMQEKLGRIAFLIAECGTPQRLL